MKSEDDHCEERCRNVCLSLTRTSHLAFFFFFVLVCAVRGLKQALKALCKVPPAISLLSPKSRLHEISGIRYFHASFSLSPSCSPLTLYLLHMYLCELLLASCCTHLQRDDTKPRSKPLPLLDPTAVITAPPKYRKGGASLCSFGSNFVA